MLLLLISLLDNDTIYCVHEITPLSSNVKRIGVIITLKTSNLFHKQYSNGATDNIAI